MSTSETGTRLKHFSPFNIEWKLQTCFQSNDTHFDNEPRATPITSLIRSGWHHIATSYNTTHIASYLDGQIYTKCRIRDGETPLGSVKLSSLIHIGINDNVDQGNAQAFSGQMDEVRFYSRSLSQEEIIEVSTNQFSEVASSDLYLYLDFNDFDGVRDKSGFNHVVSVGGGLEAHSPKIVPSTAPLIGDHLVIWAKERPAVPLSSGGTLNISITLQVKERETVFGVENIENFHLRLHNITSQVDSIPILVDANGTEVSLQSLSPEPLVLSSNNFTLVPQVEHSGDNVFTCNATLFNGTFETEPLFVSVSLTRNHAPVSGSGGYAISCDGVNDFLYSSDFEWPIRNFSTDDGYKTGGDPITVEFWGWIDESSELDSAVFSIGNKETASGWVNDFNPHAKLGRLYASVPFSSGEGTLHVGTYDYESYPVRHLYKQWNHFAMVHDQVSGTTTQVYVNGHLVVNSTHDHVGVGKNMNEDQPYPTENRVRSLMVCSWSFWSEVYHKGFIDELRIWNTSRTQEEVQENMYSSLTGNEEGLYGYWNFDDISPIAPPRGGGDEFIAKDLSSNGNDLVFGGCAPCEDYFKSWMPFDETVGIGPPTNPEEAHDPNTGYLVCLPSAKTSESPYYIRGRTYGGAHCYGDNIDLDTRPKRLVSSAPIGGHVYPQVLEKAETTAILLNGTDPDGDPYHFVIETLPDRGVLAYKSVSTLKTPDIVISSVRFTLPNEHSMVYFQPSASMGGAPLTFFSYFITDGLVRSQLSTVEIHLKCPKGQHIDSTNRTCVYCGPGSFSNKNSLDTSCELCAQNMYQNSEGATKCKACKAGTTFADVGAKECSPCSSIRQPATIINVDKYMCESVLRSKPGKDQVIQFTNDTSMRVQLGSFARFGELFQAVENEDGSLSRGPALVDAFSTAASPIVQYASRLISYSSEMNNHNASEILGEPDVEEYGDRTKAWAPNGLSETEDYEYVEVGFDVAIHVESVTVFESFNSGNVVKLEAFDAASQSWSRLWRTKQTKTLSHLNSFSPSICPTFFVTRRIRISVKTSGLSGMVQLDAVQVSGFSSMSEFDEVYVTDPQNRLIYQPAPYSGHISAYVDSFTYTIRDCKKGIDVDRSVMTMDIQLDPTTAYLSPQLSIIFTATAVIGIILSLVTSMFIIVNRKETILKATSINFSLMTTVACLASFITAIVFSQLNTKSSTPLCVPLTYLIGFSIIMLFAPFLLKLHRINWIFHKRDLAAKVTSNEKLILYVALIYATDLIINTVWAIIDPLERTLIPSENEQVYECQSRHIGVFVTIHYCTKIPIILATVVYCYKTRNVPSMFNETKSIGFVAYNAAFFGLLTMILVPLTQGNIDATVTVINIGLQMVGFVSLIVLFYPRFFVMWFDPEYHREKMSPKRARRYLDGMALQQLTITRNGSSYSVRSSASERSESSELPLLHPRHSVQSNSRVTPSPSPPSPLKPRNRSMKISRHRKLTPRSSRSLREDLTRSTLESHRNNRESLRGRLVTHGSGRERSTSMRRSRGRSRSHIDLNTSRSSTSLSPSDDNLHETDVDNPCASPTENPRVILNPTTTL